MIFGNNTRLYLENNKLDFSNKIDLNEPIYKTRLQTNLNNMGTVSIPMFITKKDIRNLLTFMELDKVFTLFFI